MLIGLVVLCCGWVLWSGSRCVCDTQHNAQGGWIDCENAETTEAIDKRLLGELIAGMPKGYRGVDEKVAAKVRNKHR